MRQLVWMARGKTEIAMGRFEIEQKHEWSRVSHILAMIHNTTRSESRDCKQPSYFNPLYEPPKGEADAETEDNDASREIVEREIAKQGQE